MLQHILLTHIVKQLAEETDSIAFAVQSATIGCVTVKLPHRDIVMEDPFGRIHKLYDLFDTCMTSFSQLSRISALTTAYVFAGEVLTMPTKSDKHAEEATPCAHTILNSAHEIRNTVGSDVSLLIGITIDGPFIGGVMNVQRPAFQLVGSAVAFPGSLAEKAVVGQIYETRVVSECIYSHHFRVTDRGDTNLQNGKSVHTYVIIP
jgi:hypothetical protein